MAQATRVTGPTSQSSNKPSIASRLSGKADEGNQRRNSPSQTAWGSGVNPITQKFTSNPQSNGVMTKSGSRSAAPDSSASQDRTNSDSHATILSQSLGQLCTLITKEGGIFVGTLAAVKAKQAENLLLCRMVRIGSQNDVRGPQKNVAQKQYIGHGSEHIVVFPSSQISSVVPLSLSKVSRAAAGKGFMTDAEISGNAAFKERKLERWQAPTDSLLPLNNSSDAGEWDQFKVNQEKFGVKSDYDESQYTTVIDKSSPLYIMRERNAAKIAAEIEGDAKSSTFTEKRGTNDEDYDEEDLYSGVRRTPAGLPSGQPNRYVPPSRRAQQAANAAKDSLADPAIISAQVARKDGSKDGKTGSASDAAASSSNPAAQKEASTSAGASGIVKSPSAATAAKAAAAPGHIHTHVGLGQSSGILPDVRTAFKNFATMEKMKVQDNKRRQQSHDKQVKVNDLKKFAQNFKLSTPVPKDLLPILAKSETKQNEIVKKAQEQAEMSKVKQELKSNVDAPAASSQRQSESASSGQTLAQVSAAATANAPSPVQNGLAERLEKSRRSHISAQPTITTTGQAQSISSHHTGGGGGGGGSKSGGASGVTSPTRPSARPTPTGGDKKLNVSASVFVPNAMAQPFKPVSNSNVGTNVSSPSTRQVSTRPITPNMPQPRFLREAKARDARGVKARPITAQLQQAKTLKPREEKTTEQNTGQQQASGSSEKGKSASVNKPAAPFKERVNWLDSTQVQSGKEDELPSYKDAFAAKARGPRNMSHPASPGVAARGPHPGPYSMGNGMPNMHPMGPHQMPMPMPPQPHYPAGGHFDEHMRPAPAMQPYPSPRMNNVYPSPMPHGPMGFHQGYMSPGAHGLPPRQYSNGRGGMPGPQMQPPMMAPQGSTGPYGQQQQQQPMMPVQHGPPYQVGQPMYPGPPQTNGFPSPGRAPPMMPSNSHQGPGPVYTPNSQYVQPVYHHHHPGGPMGPRGNFNGQPHYPQSPYQQHPYPARTPSHGYAQPHQAPVQPSPGPVHATIKNNGDEAK